MFLPFDAAQVVLMKSTNCVDQTKLLKAQSHGHCEPPLQDSCRKQTFAFCVCF